MAKVARKFVEFNKDYYRHIENYDWIPVADKLKGLESLFHRYRENVVLSLINRHKRGKNILDAGCGTGLILRHLPKGTYGIDLNPRNISKAKLYAPHAKLIVSDIEKMPFKDNFFTTIICTEVIEHQPNPIPTINELRRVLKTGGVLVGSVPSKSPVWLLRFLSSTCPREEPFHKHFLKKELENLFKNFKIKKLKLSVLGMNYFFVLEK